MLRLGALHKVYQCYLEQYTDLSALAPVSWPAPAELVIVSKVIVSKHVSKATLNFFKFSFVALNTVDGDLRLTLLSEVRPHICLFLLSHSPLFCSHY